MWSSKPAGPASGGAVAVGVALLFGTGAFGFYMLNKVTRPSHAPLPTPNRINGESGEDHPRQIAPVPAVQTAGDDEPDFNPFDHLELPDFFSTPNVIMGAVPMH